MITLSASVCSFSKGAISLKSVWLDKTTTLYTARSQWEFSECWKWFKPISWSQTDHVLSLFPNNNNNSEITCRGKVSKGNVIYLKNANTDRCLAVSICTTLVEIRNSSNLLLTLLISIISCRAIFVLLDGTTAWSRKITLTAVEGC